MWAGYGGTYTTPRRGGDPQVDLLSFDYDVAPAIGVSTTYRASDGGPYKAHTPPILRYGCRAEA